MSASLASSILALGIVAFVAIASAMLMWNGLAAEFAKGRAGARARLLHGARARLLIGVLGFALALWLALGLLTRAW